MFGYAEEVATQELISYITGQRSQGITAEQIRSQLTSSGWQAADIEQAFTQLGMTPQADVAAAMPTAIPPTVAADPNAKPPKTNFFDFRGLRWYEWAAILPAFFLVMQGGLLGGIIGFLGWTATLKYVRRPGGSRAGKIFGVIGITVLYYIIFSVGAMMLMGIFAGLTAAGQQPTSLPK